jgi:predicted permease
VLVLGLLLVFLCGVSLNVANLMLARCASRGDELALRTALGAPRSRIITLLFIESLVVSLTAAVIGIVAVDRGLWWLRAKLGFGGPFWLDLSINPAVVVYAVALAMTASALAGIVPALRVTRGQAVPGLGGKGRLTPIALGRFASVLLATQLAVSLALLATAGLLAEGLFTYNNGSQREESQVLTAVLFRDPAVAGVKAEWGSPELRDLRLQVEQTLSSMPGAAAAAVSLSLPRAHDDDAQVEVEGQAVEGLRVQKSMAGPGFFEVLGVQPTFGRTFAQADARPDAPSVAVVSERFVSDALGGQSAIGRRFRWVGNTSGAWIEIIGVVPDLGLDPGDRSAHGEVYAPLVGTDFMYASVRTYGPPAALGPALRTAIASVDPRIRVTGVQSLSDVGWEARALLSGGSSVLALLGIIALLLSLAGVYSLASLAVTSRTREIGIRLAMGATRSQVLGPVLGRTALQLGIGTGAGIALAFLLARALAALPITVPLSIGIAVPAAAALLLIAGVIASWLPARRAMRVDPVEALRAD